MKPAILFLTLTSLCASAYGNQLPVTGNAEALPAHTATQEQLPGLPPLAGNSSPPVSGTLQGTMPQDNNVPLDIYLISLLATLAISTIGLLLLIGAVFVLLRKKFRQHKAGQKPANLA